MRERLLDIQLELPEITIIILYLSTILAVIFKFRIFIYNIEILKNNELIIKYQKFNKHKLIKVYICNINLEFVPSGKNNPYLKFMFLNENSKKILKQKKIREWDVKIMKKFVNDFNEYKNRIETEKNNKI